MPKLKIILVSGIPGSGKSSEVRRLAEEIGVDKVVIITVNDFFLKDDVFHYVHLVLPYAQDEAHRKYDQALDEAAAKGTLAIIVEDIFSKADDLRYYLIAVHGCGFDVELVTMECDPATALDRQIHDMHPGYVVCRDRDLRARVIPETWGIKRMTVIDTNPLVSHCGNESC